MATINFSPAQVRLLFQGGSYSRTALIILDNKGARDRGTASVAERNNMKFTIVPLVGEKRTL